MVGALILVPEYPRYLVEVGKLEESNRSLAISNKCTIEDQFVLSELNSVTDGIVTLKELFSGKGEIFTKDYHGY